MKKTTYRFVPFTDEDKKKAKQKLTVKSWAKMIAASVGYLVCIDTLAEGGISKVKDIFKIHTQEDAENASTAKAIGFVIVGIGFPVLLFVWATHAMQALAENIGRDHDEQENQIDHKKVKFAKVADEETEEE